MRSKRLKAWAASGLLAISISAQAEVPTSIEGTWQFDSVRTLIEHTEALARQSPEVVTPEVLEHQRSVFQSNAEEVDKTLIASISSTHILMRNADEGGVMTYKELGGSGDRVRLDALTEEGKNFVLTIRFVEGGIAMETVDCQQYPHLCEVARGTPNQDSSSVGPGELGLDAYTTMRTRGPRWVYFKRAQ